MRKCFNEWDSTDKLSNCSIDKLPFSGLILTTYYLWLEARFS